MHLFDLIAEQRIAEAIANGELDDLPGAGRPLELEDDRLVPEDVRVAYRILRNAGLVPPEVATLKERALARLDVLRIQRATGHMPGIGRLSLNSTTPRITR